MRNRLQGTRSVKKLTEGSLPKPKELFLNFSAKIAKNDLNLKTQKKLFSFLQNFFYKSFKVAE